MQATYKLNAVLLAGDRRASVKVCEDNKAFLELRGKPLFIHVLTALLQAETVEKIVIVGPSDRLRSALDEHGIAHGSGCPVNVLEQRDNMIENFKVGYVASLGLTDVSFWDLKGTSHENTPALVAPCDIPLLTPREVDEYVARSNMHEYDYSIGITSEKVLSQYHPQEDKPGIQMIYFHVREDLMRHNNLHIGKPLRFAHLDYIEKMYEWRYQTRLANILRMFFSLLFSSWRLMKSLRIFILMQISLYYDRHGHPKLSDRLRSLASFNRLAEGIGNALGARVQIVYTHFGGAALDADNSKDLATIEARYDEWMKFQEQMFN
jgi:GTP:adenosylcobinamide-phosphate guanylyltransferase